LETATLGGSVFLGRGNFQLASRLGDAKVSHSNSLLSDISGTLEDAGLSLQDVELLACASGPGSFTGLRIGVATLKALAATLGVPCIGVSTLPAVAHAAGPSRATVALLPAGRGELFSQMFSVSNDGHVTELDVAAHVSPERLMEKYGPLEEVTWAGIGAHAQVDFLKSQAQERGITFHEMTIPNLTEGQKMGRRASRPPSSLANVESQDKPSASLRAGRPRSQGWRLAPKTDSLASHVAALALQLFESGAAQSAHTLTAVYVRPSDAELKERCL
ncbi:MAG TPA: tRNA (adenosine(37)-N6)-threonylcarbamoyltransferase complex dimerization subunit type 1 TsaB, partial [Pyrinomonadaceae bacterium]|nr:tRNA (adenosine(37)-N6)-threonylcarbamoyltransferase complex dimerization subunit type 1 TsaB [Pyrinomonadaceae bacterium]